MWALGGLWEVPSPFALDNQDQGLDSLYILTRDKFVHVYFKVKRHRVPEQEGGSPPLTVSTFLVALTANGRTDYIPSLAIFHPHGVLVGNPD